MQVAFLGLGVMGFPMAGHVHQAGFEVCVFNRHVEKARSWVAQYGGRLALSPDEAVRGADVVLMCLGRDEDVAEVVFEGGVLAALKRGAVLVDHTTTSAQLALRLAKACEAHGVDFLDAPVSGGESGAQSGVLSVMVGGKAEALARIQAVMQSYTKAITLVGGTGDGQRCKMVNQMAIAGVLQGLSEALAFAKKADLDTEAVIAAIEGGAAGSWQLSHRARSMLAGEFDFGFALDWMVKDLGYALDESARVGAVVPLNRAVLARYQALQGKGLGRLDTSALIRALDLESFII